MQIKRHCLLIEVMHSEDFFSGVNTPASSSKQAAQAKPKGLLRLLCAGSAENVKQPGFSVEPETPMSSPSGRLDAYKQKNTAICCAFL